ncbi:hypothetical protein K438DRAFT_1812602 [Mycena galopus ATCC 62051]|nr:hypothetical protein K438DRAFT_1812577 [Mycena galopus ATCC 62051]KAF8208631.1 hypothetical protein K438DRAFT_1812602 [Mycena galopus ATCC 62051]
MSVLTSLYLHSTPLSPEDLRKILNAHNGVDFALNTGLRNVNTAITAITRAKIAVDWKFILDEASTEKSSYEVNNIMRGHFRAKVIVKPIGLDLKNVVDKTKEIESPLTTSSKSEAEGIESPKPAEMDVDDEDEWVGISPFEVGTGGVFYEALEKHTTDENWTIAVLVKDCTKDPANRATQFANGVKIPLAQYGPDGLPHCLFAHTKDVLSELEENGHSPAAPWDAYWCLSGYPWIVGPIARLHNAGDDIQLNSSKPMLREIPVTGSEEALRLMIVFKHPHDDNCTVPGLEDIGDRIVDDAAEAAAHANDITPYCDEGDVPQDVKMEEDDVKPTTNKKVSERTLQKNREIEEFLVSHFVPLRPALGQLRTTQRTAKNKVAVPQLVQWINEVHYLHTTYTEVTISHAPASIFNKRISHENWCKVIGRSSTYVKQCMKAYKYIEERKGEWDIAQFLADESQMAGVDSVIQTISEKSWIKIYTRPLSGPQA